MVELSAELKTFCARRTRWVRFLKGRIGADGTGLGVEKEERLLGRVVEKGARLAKAIEAAEEEAICALGEVREIEQLLGLTLPPVDELHRRFEEEELEEEVGIQELVGELQGAVDEALAGRAETKGVVAAGTGSRAGGAEAAGARTGAG
eukprot:SAG11_NODE_98_length_16927_cov_35.166211_1_plen_148_part_10